MQRVLPFVAFIVGTLLAPGLSQAQPIVIDGNLADWAGRVPLISDAEGDGPTNQAGQYFPGEDFRSVTLANDADSLYILLGFAGPYTGGIALFLDTDLNPGTGCGGAEVAVFVTGSEPGASLALSDYRTCQLNNTFPGAVTSLIGQTLPRFVEAALPLSTLRTLTPGMAGFRVWGIAIAPPPSGVNDAITPALYFTSQTITPVVTLQVNDADPALTVVNTTGPVRLTVDIPATAFTRSLNWYWALVIDGQVLWITASGIATTPAPFVVSPPFVLNRALLLDLVLPPGTTLTNAWFLFDGPTPVSWDFVTAVVTPAPVPAALHGPTEGTETYGAFQFDSLDSVAHRATYRPADPPKAGVPDLEAAHANSLCVSVSSVARPIAERRRKPKSRRSPEDTVHSPAGNCEIIAAAAYSRRG